jgi:hypothetical protein
VDAIRQTRVDEHDRVFVTNGSRICPHPSLLRYRPESESFEDYTRRHARAHKLGDFDNFEDVERNVGVWCMYYLERHILGNESLGVEDEIVAAWEPCWEDAEYLANWEFAETDTEQYLPMGSRSFRLKPYDERDHSAAVFKRFKKYTKVRRTQKTSKGKALATFEHLHARFVQNNHSFRMLIISASSTLGRDHYLQPLADIWDNHENLQRLYGTTWHTKRYAQLIAQAQVRGVEPDPDLLEAETRKLCLLSKGSRPKDTLRMRWAVNQKNSSGKSAISFKIMGMTTMSAGNRWDFIIVDDPVNSENSQNDKQRRKVELKIADLRKQGDANSRIVYFNTPWHIDDASSRIDKEQGDQWHIMYRPGMWFDTATGAPIYYWEKNALPPGDPKPGEPAANDVWTPDLIEAERTQPDFYSQILLQPKNPETSIYEETDFQIVEPTAAPLDVTAGLGGRPITDEQAMFLRECRGAKADLFQAVGFIDTSGNDKPTMRGDDTFGVFYRLSYDGNAYIVRLFAGQMNVSVEQTAAYEAWSYSGASSIEYEVSGGHEKFVRQSYAEFQAKKSKDLQRPVMMPLFFRNARSSKSKYVRIPQMHPFIKAGRVRILSDAASPALIKKFITQWVDYGSDPHDDGPDAASRVLYHLQPMEQFAGAVEQSPESRIELHDDGSLTIPPEVLFAHMAASAAQDDTRGWGDRG